MAKVKVINDEGQEVETEIVSEDATLLTDDEDDYSPTVVQNVKFDHKGQMSSITTECGETENRRQSNNRPNVTVEGIVPNSELETLKSFQYYEEISLSSDLYKGRVIVERLSITQANDLVWMEVDDERELAYSFQIQFKQPE